MKNGEILIIKQILFNVVTMGISDGETKINFMLVDSSRGILIL